MNYFRILLLAMLFPASLTLSSPSHGSLAKVKEPDYPFFHDDLGYRRLKTALDQSLLYLETVNEVKGYMFSEGVCTKADLVSSIRLLKQITMDAPPPQKLQARIRDHFDVYQVHQENGSLPLAGVLVTGYYQPAFAGSLQPSNQYRYPLYRIPSDLVVQRKGSGQRVEAVGRFEKGKLVPYWSRYEIERSNLLRGQELVWLKNPLDAFFLHVQGSGHITLPDGTVRSVRFAQRNGRPYGSIGRYMVDTGKIPLESASLQSIRSYIDAHPGERDEILHKNESFIFFRWSETTRAVGSLDRPLTPGRSVAADREVYPPGAVALLVTRQPDNLDKGTWKVLRRFVTVQDSGAAINGPGRVDVFWGTGEDAGNVAGRMKEEGQLYILLPKNTKK